MSNTFTRREKQEGIALLITLLLMGVLLSIGASLINITLKQYQFAGLALASESAFQAANAGMECVLYHDFNTDTDPVAVGIQAPVDVPGDGSEQNIVPSILCMEGPLTIAEAVDDDADRKMKSSEEQRFQFSFGNPNMCTEVSVYKFHDASNPILVTVHGVNMRKGNTPCPIGGVCTVVQARGYNVSCAELNEGTNPRIVEREYTQVY